MAQRLINIIVILVILDLLFAAAGITTNNNSSTACFISMAKNGFLSCSLFATGMAVFTLFSIGFIVSGFFISNRPEQYSTIAFVTAMMTMIVPDIIAFDQAIVNDLTGIFGQDMTFFIVTIIIAPLAIMAWFAIYDWWRSPLV